MCSHLLQSCLLSASFGVLEHGCMEDAFTRKEDEQRKLDVEILLLNSRNRLHSAAIQQEHPRKSWWEEIHVLVHSVHPFL